MDKLRVLIGRERIAAEVAEMGQRISRILAGGHPNLPKVPHPQAYIAWVGISAINPRALYPYMSFRNLTALSFELRL